MSTRQRAFTKFRCAICGRRLRVERFIFSTHTRARYCWPGEGCWKKKTTTKKKEELCAT